MEALLVLLGIAGKVIERIGADQGPESTLGRTVSQINSGLAQVQGYLNSPAMDEAAKMQVRLHLREVITDLGQELKDSGLMEEIQGQLDKLADLKDKFD